MPDTALERLVRLARLRASYGLYDGRVTPESQRLIRRCTHLLPLSPEHQANLIYTRDIGHHSSGWWKNPDYERCMHLSLSYRTTTNFLSHDRRMSERIARTFFGENCRLAWIEGPYSPEGRAAQVWHYRVFCDPTWTPFLPRGEVYDRSWTPADWRSFSDVHGYLPAVEDAPFLLDAGAP